MSAVQKRGRPTQFTPKLGQRICARVAKVGFEAVAAELVGVHRHTLRHWRERGEKGEEPFAEFAAKLAAAKAQYIRGELAKVEDPRWKLERMDREQFGHAQKLEHTGAGGGAIKTVNANIGRGLSPRMRLQIVEEILGVPRELVDAGQKMGELSMGDEAEPDEDV